MNMYNNSIRNMRRRSNLQDSKMNQAFLMQNSGQANGTFSFDKNIVQNDIEQAQNLKIEESGTLLSDRNNMPPVITSKLGKRDRPKKREKHRMDSSPSSDDESGYMSNDSVKLI